MAKSLLIGQVTPPTQFLVEDKGGKKEYFFEGLFGFVDEPTKNGRVYPRSIMERESRRVQQEIEEGRFLGELDHPADGKTLLGRVAHQVVKLEIRENGEIWGRSKILGTPNGQILRALYEAGVPVGISSRGLGSTKPSQNGTDEVVQDDYLLKAFDAVHDPANDGAYPRLVSESVENQSPFDLDSIESEIPSAAAEIEKRVSARTRVHKDRLREEVSKELEETFAARLDAEIGKMHALVRQELKEEMDSDPESMTYKAIVEAVATLVQGRGVVEESETERAAEIRRLREETDAARRLLKEAHVLLAIERNIPEDHRQKARDLCARTAFASLDEATDFVRNLATVFPRKDVVEVVSKDHEAMKDALRKLTEHAKALKSENDSLREEVANAARANAARSLPGTRSVDALLESSRTVDEVRDTQDREVRRLRDAGLEGAKNRAADLRKGTSGTQRPVNESVRHAGGFDDAELRIIGDPKLME